MTERNPNITYIDIGNARKAVATAMVVAYFGGAVVVDKVDDFVRRDFYEQYLDEGQCMTNSRYYGGKIAVSGFMWPGETTVTVEPNESFFALNTSPTLVFVAGEEGYVPVSPDAVAATNAYDCPPGAPKAP